MSQEIATVHQTEVAPVALGTLAASTPAALVSGATEMAGSLSQVIQQQNLAVPIQGRQYVRVEGWTTLGVMMGVVAREVATTESEGIYTAVVELVRITDSVVVSRASAECGEESPWCNRPRYARRSMAQTRATSKACRLAFSWVMTLAGYEATPAEEMVDVTNVSQPSNTQNAQLSVKASSGNQQASEQTQTDTITAKDHRMLEAVISDLGLDRERVKVWLKKATAHHAYGAVLHLNELPQNLLEPLLDRLDQWSVAQQQQSK